MNKSLKYNKFYYECIDCGNQFSDSDIRYLCPDCEDTNTAELPPKGVFKIFYNYNKIYNSFNELKKTGFIDLLPLAKLDNLPNLRIGNTPLYGINSINGSHFNCNLYLKDDSQNPTYSFKDRASSLVSAFAKEQNINTIITASTGNAGSSLAGMCAAQSQKAIIILPENAPIGKLTQSLMYGAKVIRVKGSYDDAFDLSVKATKQFGFYNRNTAFNPLTIEGKKTVSFELFEQLGQKVPDKIFVPVGDGVIISGVYKGFEDLLKMKLIDKMPVIVAVQSEGSANLVKNISANDFTINPSITIADSISVDIPRNFYMAQYYITQYEGEWLTVSDNKILEASRILSQNTGLFTEPASAAAFAGFLSYRDENKFEDNSANVVLLTGSGLKDLSALKKSINMPESIAPDLNELNNLLP